MTTDLPVLPKHLPTNRSVKRPYVKDASQALLNLDRINSSFLYELFNNSPKSYLEIYNTHLIKWLSRCRRMAHEFKDTVVINENWFADMYQPKEG